MYIVILTWIDGEKHFIFLWLAHWPLWGGWGCEHYRNQSRGYLIGGRSLWPPAVPWLAARSSQSNPRGSGPEVLKCERSHVTAETGVAEVGVFRALQPNGFLWWAPSAKRKDHHGVSSGWSSVWHRSNTGLSTTQYEQISIILGVWPLWLTPFFFRSITFWRAYG